MPPKRGKRKNNKDDDFEEDEKFISKLPNYQSTLPPKRGKRKNNKDEDHDEDERPTSKWANLLQENDDEEEGDAEQIYNKPNKAVYQYDFSQTKILDQKQPIKIIPKDKFADLTPEQKQQLQRMREKARIDKAEKQKVKKQKKAERKKQLQVIKAKEQEEKEKQQQQQKKVQEQISKHKKQEGSPWTIPMGLLFFIILMMFLQYNKEIYERLSKFKINQQQNYYDVLQSDQGSTDSQLKSKYKKLVLKYHPDRNPNCQNCHEKFDKIMEAWQILGDSQKRKSYDKNSGYVSEIKSSSITLTPRNYNYLVEGNRHIWLIQVFDSTSEYSRYFGQFWQELYTSYGDFMKFGRIDIWNQEEMLSYIPYRFQVFPGLYIYDAGYTQICSFDMKMPLGGMKRCVEQVFQKDELNVVNEPVKYTQGKEKISVMLNGRLRANLRVKAINKKFQEYFDFYYLSTQSTKREAILYVKDSEKVFQFAENNKKTFQSYSNFLESFIIQSVSSCTFLSEFQQRKCIIILQESKIPSARQQMPLSLTQKIPVIYINDAQPQINFEIEKIKNITEMHEDFDLGVYQAGRIDLGYLNEADQLTPGEGELFELSCKVRTWKEKIFDFIDALF